MNWKNLTTTEPVTPSAKLQQARAKSGKQLLPDRTRVDIRLSRALAAAAADPGKPKRLHISRGHFKIRITGVVWWSAHPRGSAEAGVIRQ